MLCASEGARMGRCMEQAQYSVWDRLNNKPPPLPACLPHRAVTSLRLCVAVHALKLARAHLIGGRTSDAKYW